VWVPVRIKDDDGVGSLQVESEAAGASAQNEEKDLGIWIIEHRQQVTSVLALCRPIKTQVLVAFITTLASSREYITHNKVN